MTDCSDLPARLIVRRLCVIGWCAALIACSGPQTSVESNSASSPETGEASPRANEATRRANSVECTEPRPQICHKMLRPVCATRDNGVRCVTTPCDSTDEVTYPNECLACADPAVYAYREGACSEANKDS